MKEETKQLIMKVLTVIGFGSLVTIVILIVIMLFFDIKGIETLIFCCFIISMITGYPLVILMIAWGGFELKPVKAERVTLNFKNEKELEKLIEDKLSDNQKTILENNNGIKCILYTKKSLTNIECFAYMKTKDINKTVMQEMEKQIMQKIVEEYNLTVREYTLKLIELVSVDKITSGFEEIVNNNIVQEFYMCHLPCGITWDNNTLYMAKQKDGLFIAQYKHLRKRLIKILGIDPKTIIKK